MPRAIIAIGTTRSVIRPCLIANKAENPFNHNINKVIPNADSTVAHLERKVIPTTIIAAITVAIIK